MHIVVAVRHGLEVPVTLPQYLVPEKYEVQGICRNVFDKVLPKR